MKNLSLPVPFDLTRNFCNAELGLAWQYEQGGLQTFSGEVMDDLCAKDKTHGKMKDQMKSMGNDFSVCSKKSVELGAKYVLFDQQKDTVYGLADQEKAEAFAGHKVRVSGTFDKKRIRKSKIEFADSAAIKRNES